MNICTHVRRVVVPSELQGQEDAEAARAGVAHRCRGVSWRQWVPGLKGLHHTSIFPLGLLGAGIAIGVWVKIKPPGDRRF